MKDCVTFIGWTALGLKPESHKTEEPALIHAAIPLRESGRLRMSVFPRGSHKRKMSGRKAGRQGSPGHTPDTQKKECRRRNHIRAGNPTVV